MSDQEAFRAICEAREWLRRGYTTKAKVDQLMDRITKRRGRSAAEKLRTDMREQWGRRAEWKATNNGLDASTKKI